MEREKELKILNEKYESLPTKGLVVSDGEILFSLHPEKLFSAANLIKLPIYLYYYENAVYGELDVLEEISVPSQGRISGKGILHLLPEIEVWTVEELLKAMIAVSDHEATNQLIAHTGLKPIQEWIEKKEWKNDVKLRRYLMDYASGLVNEISPQGAVAVLKEIIQLGEKNPDWQKRIEFPLLNQQFRAGLPGSLTEKEIPVLEILNKTDEDKRVLHDVALFRYKEKNIYVAALAEDVQDEAQVYAWMQEIGKLIFKSVE
ncbi:serine hydrolase [Desemzia sp. RIT804]|uniref:serine hydrolase n=1 Tax=Desemzia sp. RIT 804 TaxID=2810209 RepID=UPI00194DE0F9|nr:serine hydrolase [Desemzia sp. RIT 804]MBM6615476.1 serine hydrolase [Desemzia sp. RIT 804]